jgi:mannose-6-phosphate isomerase-like protein (cupin superfamily)
VAAVSKPFRRRPVEAAGNAGDAEFEALDYRRMYQPMAYVERHSHKVQEQVYHVLEGEGLREIADERQVVRKHDVIYLPPGVPHSISNTGLVDLIFIVATSPVTDEEPG